MILIVLIGCVTPGPTNESYSIVNITGPGTDRGVVFGKICEGGAFSIVNKTTGEKIEYQGSYPRKVSVFALHLPDGVYEFTSLSAGGLPSRVSHNPFTFTATNGKIKYIGTVIKSWSIYHTPPKELLCVKEFLAVKVKKLYRAEQTVFALGLIKDNKPDDIPVYVSNYPEAVVEEMKEVYPNLNISNFEIDIMN